MPFENLIGKAQIIFFSIGDGEPAWHIWTWPFVGAVEQAVYDREMSRKAATERSRPRNPDRLRVRRQIAAGRRAHPHLGTERQEPRRRAISAWNFSAITFSASSSPICCSVRFGNADEGELSRRLADLVRKETCAEVARAIDLGAAIKLGASEANAGGRQRMAILADVCEALVGAVFLDGGYSAAAALVEQFWGERLRTPARPLRDPKTMLQEWAQARGLPTPVLSGDCPHWPASRSGVSRRRLNCRTSTPAEGIGRSKRAAEQAAAAAMLSREGVEAAG